MMSTRVVALVLATVLGQMQPAAAQTSPPPPATPAPDKTAPPPAAAGKAPTGKRVACRDDAKAKKLRGMDLADSMQLCMAEARVDCVKQAIDKKMPLPDRKAFFKTCMDE